jgi:small subunit ribosomal protein S13
MARLVGVDLPRDKRLEVALTYIYGIGRTRALETLAQTGVDGNTRVRDLADDELVKLRDWIEATYRVEGDRAHPEGPAQDRGRQEEGR